MQIGRALLPVALGMVLSLTAFDALAQAMDGEPFVWPDTTPEDCPFERSTRIEAEVQFTGRWYVPGGSGADTWYPSWAADGSMYSTFADGTVNGVSVQGYQGTDSQSTGHARIDGDDPTTLQITVVSTFLNNPTPYAGRYPSASLHYDGVWYFGTYTLDDLYGGCQNWCVQGPFVGFRQSTDNGVTWTDSQYTPANSVFGESGKDGGKVKFGPVHMVDFGKNMEHSPDGYAYFVSHGADGPSGLANWIAGDAVYLGRVLPTPENMDNRDAFEFYTGASWSNDVADAEPILLWTGRLGSVTVTYDAPAKAYLMWLSRPHSNTNNKGTFDTLLLEADEITGPWKLVATWDHFGPQAYFVNVPSKFISDDGKKMWLLYSANFAYGGSDPAGSGYNFSFHELELEIAPTPDEPDPEPVDAGSDASTDAGDAATVPEAGPVDANPPTPDAAMDAANPRPTTATAADDRVTGSGCSCRQTGATHSGLGAGMLLGLLAAGARRRRSKRPSSAA